MLLMSSGPQNGQMRVAIAHLRDPAATDAVQQLVDQVRASLPSHRLDLALVFASAHFEEQLPAIAQELHERLGFRAFIGASAEAVIAGEHEFESQPALVLWVAHLPGVTATSFHLSVDDLQRLDDAEAVREHLGVSAKENPYFIVLGDPFSFPMPDFLSGLSIAYPGRPAVGGMASAGEEADQNILIFDGFPMRQGMVGVALRGNVEIDTIVSQGCRPIGRHMVITGAEKNVIRGIGGRTPLQVVNELIQQCSPRDVELMKQRGLLVGCVINEQQARFGAGDFLIRNPIGFDSESGALLINDLVRVGQTIQFHVRDASSATKDLNEMLAPESGRPITGALLFSCNGRGTRLFTRPHHDARAVVDACGSPPLAGFFCAGEVGPIGGRNFLHGYTASIALISPGRPGVT